ncbi:MBL fold metallo-hydrolase [Candidatus Aerophobetes bacterium]|nr:MBL fold metallo-hydrolase [Candidatus Aerophobetes bacterium]
MIIKKLIVGELLVNCYILISKKNRKAIIIDPGDEAEKILKVINEERLKVIYVINTHAHIDHTGGNDIIREETGASLLIHFLENNSLRNPFLNLSIMMSNKGKKFLPPTRTLEDGDKIEVEEILLRVLHTPGHTPGSICLYNGKEVFTGDTLFAGSVGRVDLPMGNREELELSIRKKLLTLPDEIKVYPGHGPETTIGEERRNNLFINEFCAEK